MELLTESIPMPITWEVEFSPPIIFGDIKAMTLSIDFWSNIVPNSVPPDSTKTPEIPLLYMLENKSGMLIRELCFGISQISTFGIFEKCELLLLDVAIIVVPGCFRIIEFKGVLKFVSKMILNGWWELGLPDLFRAVNFGSSLITVFTPTIIASESALSWCTNLLDFSPDIHFESPVFVAILPSKLIANFAVMNGDFFVTNFKYPSRFVVAFWDNSPSSVSTPSSCSFFNPCP